MTGHVSFQQHIRDNNLVEAKYAGYDNRWLGVFVAFCKNKIANLNWESITRKPCLHRKGS